MGLTRRIRRAEFDADPAGVARRQWEDPRLAAENREFAQRMEAIPCGAERLAVEEVFRRFGGNQRGGE